MDMVSPLMGQMLFEDHPTFEASRCINARQKKVPCDDCMRICPQGLYPGSLNSVDWSACDNCNLCVSACPSRSLAPSAANASRHRVCLDGDGRAEVIVTCSNSEFRGDLPVHCIAAIPWELLACFAAAKHVVLDCSNCESCSFASRDRMRALLDDSLERVGELLGREAFCERVKVVRSGEKAQKKKLDQSVSRRGFFDRVGREGKLIARQGVDAYLRKAGLSGASSGLLYRSWLYDVVDFGALCGNRYDSRSRMPVFGERCWGCGICKDLCPQEALRFEDMEHGETLVVVDPLRCTGCGVCDLFCDSNGIEGIEAQPVDKVDFKELTRIRIEACGRCGRPLPPIRQNAYCVSCERKMEKFKTL